MKILRHHRDMMTDDLVVLTDQSRYPVRISLHDAQLHGSWHVEQCAWEELERRKRERTFATDNRHDGWRGARQPWVSA